MQIVLKIDVDDVTAGAYKHFSNEGRQHFMDQVSSLLQKAATNDRAQRLRQLIREINEEQVGPEYNPEILYELFRGEEE
jgi:hypothetical protein